MIKIERYTQAVFGSCHDNLTRSSAPGNETLFARVGYTAGFKFSGTKGDDQWETEQRDLRGRVPL